MRRSRCRHTQREGIGTTAVWAKAFSAGWPDSAFAQRRAATQRPRCRGLPHSPGGVVSIVSSAPSWTPFRHVPVVSVGSRRDRDRDCRDSRATAARSCSRIVAILNGHPSEPTCDRALIAPRPSPINAPVRPPTNPSASGRNIRSMATREPGLERRSTPLTSASRPVHGPSGPARSPTRRPWDVIAQRASLSTLSGLSVDQHAEFPSAGLRTMMAGSVDPGMWNGISMAAPCAEPYDVRRLCELRPEAGDLEACSPART